MKVKYDFIPGFKPKIISWNHYKSIVIIYLLHEKTPLNSSYTLAFSGLYVASFRDLALIPSWFQSAILVFMDYGIESKRYVLPLHPPRAHFMNEKKNTRSSLNEYIFHNSISHY